MDGFFGITHRLCVQGKEWVAAFSGPQPVLHTCLYSRIDLGPLSHGWICNETNTNLQFQLKRYLCATCVWHIWAKSVSRCVCVCMCVCVDLFSVCVSVLDAEILSASAFFFFYCDTPWFNCSRFPANHMSGLLMFMPSYINQIGLKMISWCKNSLKQIILQLHKGITKHEE